MGEAFEAIRVTDNVYWVGAIDWDIRDFHGYLTERGTTYNAFLILADKITLIDTVKAPFFDEMMARIASVIEPQKIDYMVSNHAEMDHSGAIEPTARMVEPVKIFASKMGVKALDAHYSMGRHITAVADGDTLDLGGAKLSFIETRMCHWPDSMFSYLHEDKLLFSQDAFGMHLAGTERFAEEVDQGVLDHEFAKYYANILLHLGRFVARTIDKIGEMGLDLSIVAPDHGPIFRRAEDVGRIVDRYVQWGLQKPTNKAVIVYDTMWDSTAKMAHAVGEGVAAGGSVVKLMSMKSSHRSDVITELFDAGALIVGSPTLNNDLLPTIADVMCSLRGLSPRNLIGAAFGSFGWSGQAPKLLHAMLTDMDVETVAEPLRVNYIPTEEDLQQCHQLGETIAKRLQETCNA